jgi:hypothetical protein
MISGTPVRIAVVFQPGAKAQPVWFELNRKQHRIARTTYYWKDRVGDTPLLHFAVVTEGEEALYEIIFNPLDQSWTLHPQKIE